ncbi:MAG: hypothetical protein R2839_10390 [Thermomicrobiales bacterium]
MRREIYQWAEVEQVAARFLQGDDRAVWQPILDVAVARYNELDDLEAKIAFKHKAKTFVRTYNFLAAVLPYGNPEWEQLSIYLTFLTPSLPSPDIDDLSTGVLQTVDMDSYRVEKLGTQRVTLDPQDAEIDPAQEGVGAGLPEPEMVALSLIVQTFNEIMGNIEWKDEDRIKRLIADELPAKVAANQAYQNAIRQGDRANARIEHDKALGDAILALASDDMELFKQFSDNPGFRQRLTEAIFTATFHR